MPCHRGWEHKDICVYNSNEPGANDGNVGATFAVGGLRFGVLEMGVERWEGVHEGVGYLVGHW